LLSQKYFFPQMLFFASLMAFYPKHWLTHIQGSPDARFGACFGVASFALVLCSVSSSASGSLADQTSGFCVVLPSLTCALQIISTQKAGQSEGLFCLFSFNQR
jgi:hypothetical protein